jgi:predicted GNAT family N-acyltransferase
MNGRNASCSYEIRLMNWHEAQSFARPVRYSVFVREQAVSVDEEWDEWDELATHAVAFAMDGQPVGTGRLLFEFGQDARIGRMAVLAEWRRCGVGTALLDALSNLALQRGAAAITLHAQTHALEFYGRCGFVQQGEEFIEAEIPHFMMRRSLALDPI